MLELEVCKTKFKKFRGLMFYKKKNLLFVLDKEEKFNAGIHMLFVFYPIQVIWLDYRFKIVYIKRMLPFISFHIPKQKAKYIVEFVSKQNNFKFGDKFNLERFLR